MKKSENPYTNNIFKFVEILFYIFPITFILGNFFLSLNLLLFITISLFVIKKYKLTLRFEKSYLILIVFFYIYFF